MASSTFPFRFAHKEEDFFASFKALRSRRSNSLCASEIHRPVNLPPLHIPSFSGKYKAPDLSQQASLVLQKVASQHDRQAFGRDTAPPPNVVRLVTGKNVLFVCCGHGGLDSKRFVFERARDLGVRSFLLEDPANELAQELHKDKLIEGLIAIDLSPRSTLLQDVIQQIKLFSRQNNNGISFDAVTTFWDDAVALSARIAEAFRLPGKSVKSVDIAHDKHLTREVLQNAGIPTPSHYLIKCESDVQEAAATVGFPAILKPMFGAASLAVQKVEKCEDLLKVYHETARQLLEFYSEGELMGLTFDSSPTSCSLASPQLRWMVMEEFLEGPEVDVDIILRNNDLVYSCVVDDWPQVEPWFAEMGNNCPSILPDEIQRELAEMAEQCTRAMDFTDGVFHCELIYTAKGPRLIEVNPRMGGGPVWSLHKIAHGMDLIEYELFTALQVPTSLLPPPLPPSRAQCVSCGEKFFQKSCVIRAEFCMVVRAMGAFPHVVEATPLVEPGDKVVGIDDGFPTRTARFVVVAASALEAQSYAQHLLDVLDSASFVTRIK